MSDKKLDKDIEFTVREDDEGYWTAQLKIGSKLMGTMYCSDMEDAIEYLRDFFPEKEGLYE